MNPSFTDALKEAYASAPAHIVLLETIRLVHSVQGPLISMVRDRSDHTMRLETGEEVLFEAVPFRFALPDKNDQGLQELSIAIDNVDKRVSDFIDNLRAVEGYITVEYRPYLSNDLTAPPMNPPLVLTLTDISINVFEVTARATFADIINRPFPSELYTRARFPSLGG